MVTKPHTYSNGECTWNVSDLWKAAEGVEPELIRIEDVVDIEELLDSHTWSAGPMSVREILDHVDRIANADLGYPIVLTPEGWIGDGCHRIIKAWREGRQDILVVKLKTMPSPLVE
jgi:hypothetical protein